MVPANSGPKGPAVVQAGRDITGPVIIGDGNRVVCPAPPGDPAPPRGAAPDPGEAPGAVQAGRASLGGTVFQVQDGDMHVHYAPR